MVTNRIYDLIDKYVAGTATAAEREELLTWYREEAGKPSEPLFNSAAAKAQVADRMLNNLHRHIRNNKPRPRYRVLKYAAAVAFLAASAWALKQTLWNNTHKQELTITTQYNERRQITLPDSTQVWMSPHTSVRYVFTKSKREVFFEGEAFFDVAPHAETDFTVHTGKLKTRVLGTSFSISAWQDEEDIKVTLLRGAVMLAKGDAKHVLKPGQQGVFNKEAASITTHAFDTTLMLERRNGNLEYRNVRVSEITKDLEHLFGANIVIDVASENCLFYGRLKAGEDIESFLDKLCMVIEATWTKEGQHYKISKGNC